MKKLSEYKDEEALDILADLLEPASEIMADPDFARAYRANNRMGAVKVAIKNHKRCVMEILAILDGVPVEEYHCNIFSLPVKLLSILNDRALVTGFTSQVQEMTSDITSGPATENTEENEK